MGTIDCLYQLEPNASQLPSKQQADPSADWVQSDILKTTPIAVYREAPPKVFLSTLNMFTLIDPAWMDSATKIQSSTTCHKVMNPEINSNLHPFSGAWSLTCPIITKESLSPKQTWIESCEYLLNTQAKSLDRLPRVAFPFHTYTFHEPGGGGGASCAGSSKTGSLKDLCSRRLIRN